MATDSDIAIDDTDLAEQSSGRQEHSARWRVLALVGLAVVALLPRLFLALKLDVVTDEVVYLWGGKVYLSLIQHLTIHSAQWQVNYEHPPLAKLLMGLSMGLNAALGLPVRELLAGRLPSVVMGTLLVVAIYWLGRKPFGDTVALLAALALAISPWLAYFSAIAYLDMTMTTLITLAYLLLWHAMRRPQLFPVVAILVGLGAASKYPAVFVVPGIVLFTAYYYFVLRPRMPLEQRPALPWRWWIAAVLVAPLSFLLVDPAIWPNPLVYLLHSFAFEEGHSAKGHLIYVAGSVLTHVPLWTIGYMVFTKMSAFLTIPAGLFVFFALVRLVRCHLRQNTLDVAHAASDSYLVIWFISILGMFSLLNIAVGSHYYLPLTPAVALAGVAGLATGLRYLLNLLWKNVPERVDSIATSHHTDIWQVRRMIPTLLLAILAILPGLLGCVTISGAEGYTNEFFQNNEDTRLQVAYPAYRKALQWLESQPQTSPHASVGLIGSSLDGYSSTTNWFSYNVPLTQRFQLEQVDPTNTARTKGNQTNLQRLQKLAASHYPYLIWPQHMLQREYHWPVGYHVIHIISGGNTTYCSILQANS